MADVRVEISGDTAVASYAVRGRAPRGEKVPAAGEVRFARSAGGWEMVAHLLIEAR